MGQLTGLQALACHVRNDRRNVDDIGRCHDGSFSNYEHALRAIADCALHWFVAKRLGADQLIEQSEDNLLDALNVAGMNVGEALRRFT